MRAATVARVVEHCRRRVGAAERLVVAHIDPAASDVALAERQDGDGRVVAVQPFSRHHMGFQQPQQRIQHRATGAHGIGDGGQADRHPLQGVALDLAVQRLVLTKLLVKDHRQQAGSCPAPRDHMERRRRLAYFLTVPAGELLPHRLDHLPLPWDRFQCSGHILTQLSQPRSAATRASRGRLDDHALAGQVVWKGVAFDRAPACEARHVRRRYRSFGGKLVLGGGRLGLCELELHLLDKSGRALGTRPVDLTLEFGDPKFLMRNQRQIVGSFRLRDGQLGGDRVLFCGDESGLRQGFLRLRPRAEATLASASSHRRAGRPEQHPRAQWNHKTAALGPP